MGFGEGLLALQSLLTLKKGLKRALQSLLTLKKGARSFTFELNLAPLKVSMIFLAIIEWYCL